MDFKIQNSIWITEDSDNGDSDNWGSTVFDTDRAAKYQVPELALIISGMYVAHAQNSFYHCRMI